MARCEEAEETVLEHRSEMKLTRRHWWRVFGGGCLVLILITGGASVRYWLEAHDHLWRWFRGDRGLKVEALQLRTRRGEFVAVTNQTLIAALNKAIPVNKFSPSPFGVRTSARVRIGGRWSDILMGALSDGGLICLGLPQDAGPFWSEYTFCEIAMEKEEALLLFNTVNSD